MKLDLGCIRQITFGAVSVEEESDGFHFYRFENNQANAYLTIGNKDFYNKTRATANVRFSFLTDASKISFKCRYISGCGRPYAYFDAYQNKTLVGHAGLENPTDELYDISFDFSQGDKLVEIYFPWSRGAVISDVEIDGEKVVSHSRKYKMLSFGDSITQGYDARYPSLTYVSKLASMLDADVVNRGIGGDTFCPEIVLAEPYNPDFITVGYGTNDWHSAATTAGRFNERCGKFFKALSGVYPNVPIYAIAPIWRGDIDVPTKIGVPLCEIKNLIKQATAGLPNVKIIDAMPFVPHLKEFYADGYLHPSDLGFCEYANGLYNSIAGK